MGPSSANERSQIHERGIVEAGAVLRQQLTRVSPQRFAALAGIDGNLQIEEPSEQTRRVCLDDRNGLIKGERRHGVRGITADSRKIPNRLQ